MNPIPLTSPSGVVYAYACGRCHHVAAGSSKLWRPAVDGPYAQLVEASRLDAEQCCICRECGGVQQGWMGCDSCRWWRRFTIVFGEIGDVYADGLTEEQWRKRLEEDE